MSHPDKTLETPFKSPKESFDTSQKMIPKDTIWLELQLLSFVPLQLIIGDILFSA